MIDSNTVDKDNLHQSEDNIPVLVKKIKTLKFKKIEDLVLVSSLSESIYDEWLSIRRKYRNEVMSKEKTNNSLQAECEAEEELVVGLLFLLNEKIINFVMPIK